MNNKKRNTPKEQNLTHHELNNRLQTYSQFSKETKDAFEFERLRQTYLKEMKEREANRNKSELNYTHGERIGLNQQPIEQIRDTNQYIDNKYRNEIHADAKQLYDKNPLLSKDFANGVKQNTAKSDFNSAFDKYNAAVKEQNNSKQNYNSRNNLDLEK